MRMHYTESEELAAMILTGNDEEKADELVENGELEEKLMDKFEVDLQIFHNIVEALLPYTPIMQSALTQSRFHCLGVHDKHGFRAIARIDATDEDIED